MKCHLIDAASLKRSGKYYAEFKPVAYKKGFVWRLS
jgi:hypothetical protein